MSLSIQERLKDLRVERGLTLEQLAERTHHSKSVLGSYEAEDFKDISHYNVFFSAFCPWYLAFRSASDEPFPVICSVSGI
nr:helix-turn-helix transcriptional regulator [uncultured Bacteroides sp.]